MSMKNQIELLITDHPEKEEYFVRGTLKLKKNSVEMREHLQLFRYTQSCVSQQRGSATLDPPYALI